MYALYLRKSRNDDQSESMEETLYKHKTMLYELIDKMKIDRDNVAVFEEVVSGESLKNRPEMQKLLNHVMNGDFDGVFVMDSQRLARGDTMDQGAIMRAFSLNGTKIITPLKTIDPANEYDSDFFEFDLFMGRHEYKMINRRMQRGRLFNVKDGYYLGSVSPYGYKRIKLDKSYSLAIDEGESKIVKKIFDMRLEGIGTTNIAKELNSMGIKVRKGDRWTPATVRTILKNPVYYGAIKWNNRKTIKSFVDGEIVKTRPINKEFDLFRGRHEPLISKEDFDKVQALMKQSSNEKVPKNKSLKNPLSGLVTCKLCGRKMVRRPYQNGRIATLICNTVGCHNIASDLNIVEDRLLKGIREELDKEKQALNNYEKEAKAHEKAIKKDLETINKELDKLSKQLDKACEMLENGTYTINLFKSRQEKIESKIKQLNSKKEELNNKEIMGYEEIKNMIPKLENTLKFYKEADVDGKNKILKSILQNVEYKKERNGRWDKDAINDFDLEIFFKRF